jgi:hypothetical protein
MFIETANSDHATLRRAASALAGLNPVSRILPLQSLQPQRPRSGAAKKWLTNQLDDLLRPENMTNPGKSPNKSARHFTKPNDPS